MAQRRSVKYGVQTGWGVSFHVRDAGLDKKTSMVNVLGEKRLA